MVVRDKNGEYRVGNSAVLLDFLGVKTMNSEQGIMNNGGVINVAKDVEVIAAVPFRLGAGETTNNEQGTGNNEGVAWTLSTFDLDRFGERIDPAGWDYKRYRDNPVVEWAHRYDIPAIGKIEGPSSDDGGLHGLVVFNDKDYDPFGWAIGERVKAGVIRAGSVGFRIIEIEIPSKEDSRDGTTLIFRKQELLEFSICNVPANPWALAKPMALTKSIEAAKRETKQDLCFSGFWGNIINNFEEVKHG
jgi:HK97 family phage prohead protease